MAMAAEETEITLGAGKLLGLFLMLAATCGIFFAVGYSLGKTSAREQVLKNQTEVIDNVDAATQSGKASGATASARPADAKESAETVKEPGPDLTFYNTVKQNPHQDPNSAPKLNSNQAGVDQPAALAPVKNETAHPAAAELATAPAMPEGSAGPSSPTLQSIASGTFLVQIAAVSHEEDAAALAGALRKKSYAASVVNNPNGKDKLFHVVLGPYASLQDAEAMKAKLQGEGYNPIVKR